MTLLRPLYIRLFASAALIGIVNIAHAQSVGISGASITPDPESILELRSTTKGVLLPRLTAAERTTLTAAPLGAGDQGLTIFNSTTSLYNYWDGTQWVEMQTVTGSGGPYIEDQNTADQVADFRISGDGTIQSAIGIGTLAAAGTARALIHDASATANELLLLVRDNASQPVLSVEDIGRVGINTSSPLSALDVVGKGLVQFGGDALVLDPGYVSGARLALGTIATPDQYLSLGHDGTKAYLATSGNDFSLHSTLANPGFFFEEATGNIGIGTNSPNEKLDVQGSVRGDQSGAVRISTGSGYVDVGPKNGGWSHFYTDRPRYYFDKGITVDQGLIGSYNEDLSLQTSGTDRITVLNASGDVGIGNTSPTTRLHVTGGARITDLTTGVVVSDANGNLSVDATLVGTGLGDNLGNHTATTHVNANDYELRNVKALQGKDWDDDSGGTDNKYRLLFRDGAHQFYNGGVVVGNYNNGTWGDLADGTLIVEGAAGIGTITPATELDVYGTGQFHNGVVGAPAVGTIGGNGQRLILWPGSASVTPYGLGINGSTMWRAVPTGAIHSWFTNTTERMRIASDGFVGIGTTSPAAELHVDGGTDTEVRVHSDDTGASTLSLYGDNQGTGRVFVGQSSTYGGGIEYNGNDSPTTTGAGADFITLWRRSAGTDYWTARNKYNNNDWEFRDNIDVNGNGNVDGYLTVGNPTTGSTTKKGMKIFFEGGDHTRSSGTADYDFDFNLGQLTKPDGAGTFYVKSINMNMTALHREGDEDFHVFIDIADNNAGWSWGGGGSFGLSGNNQWMDWLFGQNVNWAFTSDQTVQWEFYEENETCWLCDNESTTVYNVEAKIGYDYNSSLQAGEIAASGRIYANNTIEVGDVAEYFPVSGDFLVGDVISFIPGENNEYRRSSKAYDQFITGVVSENPSVVLNNPDVGPPVALAGRVKVNIAPGHPPIKSGDFLTSSPIEGKAMKATKAGSTIGYATTNQNPGEGFVEIMVQPGKFYIPPTEEGAGRKQYSK